VKHGKINATVPKDTDISTVTMEEAVGWLADKIAKGGGKKAGGRKGAAKKTAAKKAPAKKSTAKKTSKKTSKKASKKSSDDE
jgi:DNA topoisomerase-1